MDENNEIKRCGFYVKRKKRHCKMLPAKGNTHCAEHLCFQPDFQEDGGDIRVKCPLDSSHTVFKERLEKHLKKCNSRKKKQEKFYQENINSGIANYEFSEKEKMPLNEVPKAELSDLIKRIEECHSRFEIKIGKSKGLHSVLSQELENKEYGATTRKHLVQQASLINILEESKAFCGNTAFLEFGAGKGKLSHWLQKAVTDVENIEFILIDRQNHRNKFDCYHKGEGQGPTFKRLHVDIEHLNLGKVDDIVGKKVVGVGKHLCGAATDMSLRCLIETSNIENGITQAEKRQKLDASESGMELILFALCCFHRCSWPTYVGKDFFTSNGFTALDFQRMTHMCSWATCGFRYHEKGQSDQEENSIEKQDSKPSEDHKAAEFNQSDLKLGKDEKKSIGLQCKRLIDAGRLKYLENHGYEAELLYYVDSNITLEDIVLLARKKRL